mmetsp:Transcript_10676/g.29586  ORF Transcript_10676/g.29586 Transcript_10676/m.29586 type:complete len:360 (+) Transcript_10676:198-1277(+)
MYNSRFGIVVFLQNLGCCHGAMPAFGAVDGHCTQPFGLDLRDAHFDPTREEAAARHVPLDSLREAVVDPDVGSSATAVEDTSVEVGLALSRCRFAEGLAPGVYSEVSVPLHLEGPRVWKEVGKIASHRLFLTLCEPRLLRSLRSGPFQELHAENSGVLELQIAPIGQVLSLNPIDGDCQCLTHVHGDALVQMHEQLPGVALESRGEQRWADLLRNHMHDLDGALPLPCAGTLLCRQGLAIGSNRGSGVDCVGQISHCVLHSFAPSVHAPFARHKLLHDSTADIVCKAGWEEVKGVRSNSWYGRRQWIVSRQGDVQPHPASSKSQAPLFVIEYLKVFAIDCLQRLPLLVALRRHCQTQGV